jgi:hypothetical protein
VVFLGSFCGSLQDPTAILGPVRPMFGKARDLPRGRSARLVRHDRVRRLLSLGGRSSGRLSEDLANPPWVCGHRRRTYIRANERVQHHILQSQNGQLVTVWPEEFTTLRAKWILPAFCPRDRVGGPGHLAPGRQGGRVGEPSRVRPFPPARRGRRSRPLTPLAVEPTAVRRGLTLAATTLDHTGPGGQRRVGPRAPVGRHKPPSRPRSNIGFTAFASPWLDGVPISELLD